MKCALPILASATILVCSAAHAEPTDRWWSGWGQGTAEYGYTKSSGDAVYIACDQGSGFGTSMSFSISGDEPRPGQLVTVTIDGDQIEFAADHRGRLGTSSRVDDDIFRSIWTKIRTGNRMSVSFGSRQAIFPLAGSSRILEEESCDTDFVKY